MGFADFPVEILKALRIKRSDSLASSEAGQSVSRANTFDVHKDSISSPIPRNSSTDGPNKSPSSSAASLSLKETTTNNSETLTEVTSPTKVQSPTANAAGDSKGHNHKSNHRSFLGSAIRRRSSSRHSRDKSHAGNGGEDQSLHQSVSEQAQQISLDTVAGAGRGAGRIVSAGLKSPMDFTLSLARGFHNAPKLYGDDKVRQTEKITDLQSGLKVAGKEFGFGLYDGISGLITQPVDGARKEGVAGFLKGFGKGIAGVVIKPQGAFWALQGYTFKGIYKEIQKHFGASTENYIIAARTSQGYDDMRSSTPREREDVIARWKTVKAEVEKQKQMLKHGIHIDPEHCIFRKIAQEHLAKAAEKKLRKGHKKTDNTAISPAPDLDIAPTSPEYHPQSSISRSSTSSDSASYEEAIQRSVAATSKGDAEQDKLIGQAIRASVQALRDASQEGAHDEALNRAVKASVAEATRVDGNTFGKDLEEALHRSLQGHSSSVSSHGIDPPFDDSGIDTDDEVDVKRQPLAEHSKTDNDHVAEDAELQRAIEESEKSHKEYQDHLQKQRTEEEIVLEYMKRQSLAEAKFREISSSSSSAVIGVENPAERDIHGEDAKVGSSTGGIDD